MFGHARGGKDTMTSLGEWGGIAGDVAGSIYGHARGGDDNLFGDGYWDSIVGDAIQDISGSARGGADHITVDPSLGHLGFWAGPTALIGDARGAIRDHARGGNDTITTVELGEELRVYGDTLTMSGSARGGNDTIDSDGGRAHPSTCSGALLFTVTPI
jgi:hypothetical protein